MPSIETDRRHMARAIELAARGRGHVEPNPMVGCVIVSADSRDAHTDCVLAEGWHAKFGGPHAEIEALRIAGSRASGATMYVSLEPCCHHGKTPPCVQAILDAGIRRVVVAREDPFNQVAGKGIRELRAAGLTVDVGTLQHEALQLNAPYLKLLQTARPWIIAKWAMTLDGKLATRSGHSQWISGQQSRAVAHQLRGLVDAIMVGRGTVHADNPLLVARPPGPRLALRIVLDSHASLDSNCQLLRTARETPVLVAVSTQAAEKQRERLAAAGCEVLVCPGETHAQRLDQLLDRLAKRRMTNVLVEGGGRLIGSLWDARQIDELHVFIAPKVFGGAAAPSPIGGSGIDSIADSPTIHPVIVERLGDDVYIHGRLSQLSPQ